MSLQAIKSLFLQPTWDCAIGTWRMDPRMDLLLFLPESPKDSFKYDKTLKYKARNADVDNVPRNASC